MKVLVIIPAYNANKTITTTLDSIVNQTFSRNVKVYIIDDCSEETYNDIIEDYRNELDITLFRLEKNSGPGYARQYGLYHSNSKYVVFIDSDDTLNSFTSLETMYKVMENDKYDTLSTYMREDRYGTYTDFYVGYDTLHAKIYRRSFLEEHHIVFPYTYNSEDIAFNAQCVLNTINIGQIAENTYIYKRRKNSLTQTDDYFEKKHIKCYCDNIKFVLEHAKKYKYEKKMIANFMESQFCYFYYYFNFESTQKDKNIKFTYDLIDYYDKYIKYFDDQAGSYWLNFWTIKRNAEYDYADYAKFVDKIRKASKKEKEKKKKEKK